MPAAPQIPLIPGLSPTKRRSGQRNTQHHAFDFKNGHRVHKEAPTNFPPTMSANPTPVNRQPKVVVESSHANPDWIKYDKVVLRFFATVEEKVHERQYQGALSENKRTRKVTIYYYVATSEVHVEEEIVTNSGIQGGRFLNQMVVNGPDGVTPLQPKDFVVGESISFHNRNFSIYDADKRTRDFVWRNYGVHSAAPTPVAEDEWRRHQRATQAHHDSATPKCQITAFAEVDAGGMPRETLERSRQWINHQGEVLRFWAEWRDTAEHGHKHEYIVHYFLADDTIEVRNYNPVDGEAHFPMMLARQRLPKVIPSLEIDGIGSSAGSWVHHRELRVGQTMQVLGRDLLLTLADNYTMEFYKQTHGLTAAHFPPVDTSDPVKPWPKNATPPPTGYGTEEDSRGSCLHLVPRPPKKNFERVTKWGNTCARYLAKMAHNKEADEGRQFIISVYLADDTIAIYEKELLNSGIPVGKFMERIRLTNPATGAYFTPKDFVKGGIVSINHFEFEILECDGANAGLVGAGQRVSSFMPVESILRDMSQSAWFKKISNLTHTFRSIDKDDNVGLSQDEFVAWLARYGYNLEQDKMAVLFNSFDTNHDGTISVPEFMKRVEHFALLGCL